MEPDLENIMNRKYWSKFKSEGERRIAYFLDEAKIKYQYEKPVLVNSHENKTRIWYPDFYLPEFKTHIEYYGYTGNYQYDKSTKTKQSVYKKMELDVIPVYPWMFADDWKSYILGEVNKNVKQMENKIRTIQYNVSIKSHYSRNNNLYRKSKY